MNLFFLKHDQRKNYRRTVMGLDKEQYDRLDALAKQYSYTY